MPPDTLNLTIDLQRLQDDFETLARIGANPDGGVTRLALSNEDLQARNWFAERIESCGLFVHDDEVGNLSGILFSDQPEARTLLIGSHLDTVPGGGKYDGSIGVLAGLECLRIIKDAGLKLPVNLEVINFTDEEGCWQSFFGSMGLTGSLEEIHVSNIERDNAAFRAALFRAGIRYSEIQRAGRDARTVAGYLELHIEQGDRLAEAGVDIGVVTSIVGRTTYNVTYYGEATHAATTRRHKRRDALQGAAILITRLHQEMNELFPEGVVNCGSVDVTPATFSIVPSMVSMRVECRHQQDAKLQEMEQKLVELAEACAHDHHLTMEAEPVLFRSAAEMSPDIIKVIEDVCRSNHCSHDRLVSYAGHDAQILSHFTPSGMIFIPSQGGISHNPQEYSKWEHIEAGANVLLQTILKLALK